MKILIGTPVYNNQLDSRMVSTVLNVIQEAQKNNWAIDWDRPSSCLLSYNRNLIVQHALEGEFDWILFIDADMQIIEENWVSKLLETAHKFDVPILGIPVRLKNNEYSITWNFAHKKSFGYKNWEGELPKQPIETDVVGTGICLMNIKLFKKIPAPWFEQLDTYKDNKVGFWPEDWNFCEKTKENGYKIMVVPQIKAIHWGQYPYQ